MTTEQSENSLVREIAEAARGLRADMKDKGAAIATVETRAGLVSVMVIKNSPWARACVADVLFTVEIDAPEPVALPWAPASL